MDRSLLREHPGCNPVCRVCHYKDLTYSAQLARKDAWAERQLESWAETLSPIIPSPENERLGYRAKSGLRTHFVDDELSFGMYRAISVDGKWEKEFVSWDTCPMHASAMQIILQRLKVRLPQADPAYVADALVAVWLGNPHVVLISRTAISENFASIDWSEILEPPFNRVWFHHHAQIGRKFFGHREIQQLAGPPVNDVHPIRAFRQVAQSLLTQARSAAVDALLEMSPALVLDLYCGTGELSRLLPDSVGWIGIELSAEAIRYANTLRDGSSVTHAGFTGLIEQRLFDPRVQPLLKTPYAIYINPPRSGMSEEAMAAVERQIREKSPATIVYLSCSASSLARDLRQLEGAGYEVKSLQPYDFFPQTEHFETLAVLHPKRFT